MKLENQVCSLELSKKLKELGVRQDSLYYHECPKWDEEQKASQLVGILRKPPEEKEGEPNYYSAFTVAELGELLPICIKDGEYYLQIRNIGVTGANWIVSYSSMTNNNIWESFNSTNEADARAKMLIYLIKNKLIEVNK